MRDRPAVLAAVRSSLTPELLRSEHVPDKGRPASCGHCYVASEAVWHLLGGRRSGLTPKTVRHEGATHWWLEDKDGKIIDLAARGCFDEAVPRPKGRRRAFLTEQPSKRAQEVCRRARAAMRANPAASTEVVPHANWRENQAATRTYAGELVDAGVMQDTLELRALARGGDNQPLVDAIDEALEEQAALEEPDDPDLEGMSEWQRRQHAPPRGPVKAAKMTPYRVRLLQYLMDPPESVPGYLDWISGMSSTFNLPDVRGLRSMGLITQSEGGSPPLADDTPPHLDVTGRLEITPLGIQLASQRSLLDEGPILTCYEPHSDAQAAEPLNRAFLKGCADARAGVGWGLAESQGLPEASGSARAYEWGWFSGNVPSHTARGRDDFRRAINRDNRAEAYARAGLTPPDRPTKWTDPAQPWWEWRGEPSQYPSRTEARRLAGDRVPTVASDYVHPAEREAAQDLLRLKAHYPAGPPWPSAYLRWRDPTPGELRTLAGRHAEPGPPIAKAAAPRQIRMFNPVPAGPRRLFRAVSFEEMADFIDRGVLLGRGGLFAADPRRVAEGEHEGKPYLWFATELGPVAHSGEDYSRIASTTPHPELDELTARWARLRDQEVRRRRSGAYGWGDSSGAASAANKAMWDAIDARTRKLRAEREDLPFRSYGIEIVEQPGGVYFEHAGYEPGERRSLQTDTAEVGYPPGAIGHDAVVAIHLLKQGKPVGVLAQATAAAYLRGETVVPSYYGRRQVVDASVVLLGAWPYGSPDYRLAAQERSVAERMPGGANLPTVDWRAGATGNPAEQLALVGEAKMVGKKAPYRREQTLFEEFGAAGAPRLGEKGYRGPPHAALVQTGRQGAADALDSMIATWTDSEVGFVLGCAVDYFYWLTDLRVDLGGGDEFCDEEVWNEDSYYWHGNPAQVVVMFTPGRGWGGEAWLQSKPGDPAYDQATERVAAGLGALELAVGVSEGMVAREFAVEVLYEAYFAPEPSDRLKLVPITLKEAEAFIVEHHSALPYMPQNTAYAVGAEWKGRLVAVATAGHPTAQWGERKVDPKNVLELTRIASMGAPDAPKGTSSMLAARLLKLAPKTKRGDPAGPWLFVTYSLLTEKGATYNALRDLGLRPVELTKGKSRGGARRAAGGAALAELPKIRWEAGPAALTPQWGLMKEAEQFTLFNPADAGNFELGA